MRIARRPFWLTPASRRRLILYVARSSARAGLVMGFILGVAGAVAVAGLTDAFWRLVG